MVKRLVGVFILYIFMFLFGFFGCEWMLSFAGHHINYVADAQATTVIFEETPIIKEPVYVEPVAEEVIEETPEPIVEEYVEPEPEPVEQYVEPVTTQEYVEPVAYEEPYIEPEPEPAPDYPGAVYEDDVYIEGVLTKSGGVNYYNGRRETWYSQRVLPGGGLDIPGRHVGTNGLIYDGDGYICVAADDLAYGTVVETSLGMGKVYDCGVGSDNAVDIYTDW